MKKQQIPTTEFHFKRKEFNKVLKDLFKDFGRQQVSRKPFNWDINPDAYTFFSYYDEKQNRIIKIFCNENTN